MSSSIDIVSWPRPVEGEDTVFAVDATVTCVAADCIDACSVVEGVAHVAGVEAFVNIIACLGIFINKEATAANAVETAGSVEASKVASTVVKWCAHIVAYFDTIVVSLTYVFAWFNGLGAFVDVVALSVVFVEFVADFDTSVDFDADSRVESDSTFSEPGTVGVGSYIVPFGPTTATVMTYGCFPVGVVVERSKISVDTVVISFVTDIGGTEPKLSVGEIVEAVAHCGIHRDRKFHIETFAVISSFLPRSFFRPVDFEVSVFADKLAVTGVATNSIGTGAVLFAAMTDCCALIDVDTVFAVDYETFTTFAGEATAQVDAGEVVLAVVVIRIWFANFSADFVTDFLADFGFAFAFANVFANIFALVGTNDFVGCALVDVDAFPVGVIECVTILETSVKFYTECCVFSLGVGVVSFWPPSTISICSGKVFVGVATAVIAVVIGVMITKGVGPVVVVQVVVPELTVAPMFMSPLFFGVAIGDAKPKLTIGNVFEAVGHWSVLDVIFFLWNRKFHVDTGAVIKCFFPVFFLCPVN